MDEVETRAYHKNPADLGSRGEPVLQDEELWWRGPEWLLDSESWPAYVTTSATKETLAEVKTVLELFKLATEKKRTIRRTSCQTELLAHAAELRRDREIRAQRQGSNGEQRTP